MQKCCYLHVGSRLCFMYFDFMFFTFSGLGNNYTIKMNQSIKENTHVEPESVINETIKLIENSSEQTLPCDSHVIPTDSNEENLSNKEDCSNVEICASLSDSHVSPNDSNEENLSNKEDSINNLNVENYASPDSSEIKCNDSPGNVPQDNKSSNIENSLEYDPNNVHYEGDIAIYTDKKTGGQYQWDKGKNEWVIRNNMTLGFEDDTHIYTDGDGTKFFWDKEKSAWFPKLDDDFMARYQMSYGFNEPTDPPKVPTPIVAPLEPTPEQLAKDAKLPKGEKRKASDPTWFEVDETQNTNVYVSNLPLDIEEQEFIDLMQKCGLVMRDPTTGSFKIKLYKEPGTDYLKGDALCSYIKIESVDLATNLLDGYVYKDRKLKVEKAKFELKGQYDPKLKPKMRKKKEKLKFKKAQEKLFDWRPEKKLGERSKHERVVIIKNLFEPAIFDTDVGLILEFQQDLREEAGKIGEVRKVVLYDRHPEGVAQITMGSPEEAEQVVSVLNGRWFMKRQLTAEIWDGKTKFKIAETDSQISQRLDGWDKFLEGEEESKSNKNDADCVENVNDVDNKNIS